MRAESHNRENPEGVPSPDAIDLAAAFDDFFGGFAEEFPASASLPSDGGELFPESIDLLLLLRQAASGRVRPPSVVPVSIGRYRILSLAGRGGFSVVWEAIDPVMRRRVAVKCCSPDGLLSASVRRRFRREAELASRLVHPHIVAIHEVGEDNGLDFITTEYCSGGTLAAWLARHPGPVSPAVAARITRAVALAADCAHEAGIIHRDIKPANVMLTACSRHQGESVIIPAEEMHPPAESSGGMTVKLGDFGLGNQQDATNGEDPLTPLTREGCRLGTPAWMAPEQIDRSFGTIGPATDIHAIGLLLDRLLTGRPMRVGGTDAEIYRQVILEDPMSASVAVRGVPADLAAVRLRCLAKKPVERYESAAALADDLSRWIAGQPTIVRPLTPAQRFVRVIAGRPFLSTVSMVAVVALVVAVWISWHYVASRSLASAREAALVQQRAAHELLRGYESLRGGSVVAAMRHLERTATIDPGLAASFAGRWLERRTHGERDVVLSVRPLPGRPRDLHSVAVAPSGDAIAAGGADGRLWLIHDRASNLSAISVNGHDEINDVCFSPDGTFVASAGQDGRLRWWRIDVATDRLEPAGEAPPVSAPLYACCFTADGNAILYGGEDRVVRRVSITGDMAPREGHAFAPVDGFHQDIQAIALVSDTTAVVAYGPTLSIIDAETGRLLRPLERRDVDVAQSVLQNVAVSPGRTRIVAAGSDRIPRVWDVASGTIVRALPAHPDRVQAAAFTPAGDGVITVCRDGVGRVFDVKTGALRSTLLGHRGRILDVVFDAVGAPLTVGADGTLRRWYPDGHDRLAGWRLVPVTGGVAWGVAAGERNPCTMLVLHHIGPATVLTLGPTPKVAPVSLDVEGGAALAYDASRRRLAIGSFASVGRRAPFAGELSDSGRLAEIGPPCSSGQVIERFVAWTPDGRLVGCTADGRVLAWTPALDAVTEIGRVGLSSNLAVSARVVTAAPTLPPRVAACGQGAWIVTLGEDGKPVGSPTRLQLPGLAVSASGWSPDGSLLACGMHDGEVHVFNAASGALVGSLRPHVRFVQDLTFTPDGRTLITADTEHLRISDVATLLTFDEMEPGWTIQALGASPDGTSVVVGGMESIGLPGQERAKLAILELDLP